MDKKLFLETLADIQKTMEYRQALFNLNMEYGYGIYGLPHRDCVGSLITVLDRIVPEPENEWVSWFVYEANFGNSDCNNVYIDEKEYVIKSAEDLWDFLYNIL